VRRTVLVAIAATLSLTTLPAQFSEFAVTDDGRLYFSTTLQTEGEDDRYKVYRVTSDGLSLFATGGDPSIGRIVGHPLTSGDGSITGYALISPCRTGSCGLIGLPRINYQLQGTEVASRQFDTLQISRNGRFLLGRTFDVRTRLIDLATNTTSELPQYRFPASRQAVANSGAALLLTVPEGAPPVLYAPFGEDPRPIPGTEGAAAAFLSPNADRVAYVRSVQDGFELVLTDPQGSIHRVLSRSPNRNSFQPSFANDGTLLYLDALGRVYLLTPSGEPRTFMSILAGVSQAIISGNAELAWLTTATGQLLRVRTSDGVPDEIVPATPTALQTSLFAFPGSVLRIFGTGLDRGTRFRLGGIELPLSEVNSSSAAVQIPWEHDIVNGPRTVTIQGTASPFLQSLSFTSPDRPTITFERDRSGLVLQAAHQDFRGVVSLEDPAYPGETIHVFARNMGPVDLPVFTGQPSPSDPPARVVAPIGCYLLPVISEQTLGPAVGLAVPFAGLAGGAIGIYQIDVTIPADWTSPLAELHCRTDYRGDIHRIPVTTSPTP